MSSKLQQLLTQIDPARTLQQTAARADQALNEFSSSSARIDDWSAFKTCLVRLMRQVERQVLRLTGPVEATEDFEWGRVSRWLLLEYGLSGEKAAFEMARTGNEGGLYAVLKAVARRMAQEYAENEITARIGHYWNALSVAEKLAAPDEYLEHFGRLLPSELTEGSAARLRADFPKVLEEHPHLLQRLRHVGR